ncbi:hypothetical protein [Stutzerimonas nitrititolerans]|nr:hypothetical protein [Stutzerimonas nitrititolerans]
MIADSDLDERLVSGVFDSGKTDMALAAIAAEFDFQVVSLAPFMTLLH